MASLDSSAAKRLIELITTEHGHLGSDVYSSMDDETRRRVQEAILKKDEMIASSVMTLAKNLYTKDVRFIFELLQNADDNSYEKAKSQGATPFIRFSVHRKHGYLEKIVVDCNEDGFNEENLRAICSIGKSSKTSAKGYIGEKGIGFKSVFKVAWKVLIQSGEFSFSFQHRPHESGMGMITPIWEKTEPMTNRGPLTRMTLFLHHVNGDTTETIYQRDENILGQFESLQPTMLLFLRNLRQIELLRYEYGSSVPADTITMKCETALSAKRVTLSRTSKYETEEEEVQKICYHVSKSVITDLPRNENRVYNKEEEKTGSYGHAEVILAFPLVKDEGTSTEVPAIEPQEVFAFLPIRQAGFNFIIHTDFVTQANREDIVHSSRRNIELQSAIAQAFARAVLEMIAFESTKYVWMRYLPGMPDSSSPMEPYWQSIVFAIRDALSGCRVLETRAENIGPLKQLRYIPKQFLDQHGQPLVEDLPGARVYPSMRYDPKDIKKLIDYGLQPLSQLEFIKRVEADLARRHNSTMKSPSTNQDWHSRMAKVLMTPFDRPRKKLTSEESATRSQIINETKFLNLLPMADGRWFKAKTKAEEICFPKTEDGLAIPGGIGIPLIRESALENEDRKKLFESLWVRTKSPGFVRASIIGLYKNGWGYRPESLSASSNHLKFLYLTHEAKMPASDYKEIKLMGDSTRKWFAPHQEVIYTMDENPYSAWSILGSSLGKPKYEGATFVNKKYFTDPPSKAAAHDMGWEQWLLFLGCRRCPQLMTMDKSSISAPCQYVCEHKPSKFLGLIQQMISEDDPETAGFNASNLGMKLLCQGDQFKPPCDTFVPLRKLQNECASFLQDGEVFPFLKLEIPELDDEQSKWLFLRDWGVRDARDEEQDRFFFYLRILEVITGSNKEAENMKCSTRLLNLYVQIWKAWDGVYDLRELFETQKAIFVPSSGDRVARWVAPSGCVIAPAGMASVVPVMEIYTASYPVSEIDINALTSFFADALKIPRELDFSLVYNEALTADQGNFTVEYAKSLIWTLNSLLPSAKSAQANDLPSSCPIMPIRYPDGQVILGSTSTQFAIVDRQALAAAFRGTVKLLDFSSDEVKALKPFLTWAGTEDRYLSRMVKETICVDINARSLVLDKRWEIKNKAHELLRIAVHFMSGKARADQQAFYNTLQNATTYQTRALESRLLLSMDGQEISVNGERIEVHIQEDDTDIRLYIPEDEDEQDLVFCSLLPSRLARWMMAGSQTNEATDEAVAKLVMSVVSSRSHKAAQGVLNMEGVRDASVPKVKQVIAPSTSVAETEGVTSVTVKQDIEAAPIESTAHTEPGAETASIEPGDHYIDTNKEYRKLLSHVIDSARQQGSKAKLRDISTDHDFFSSQTIFTQAEMSRLGLEEERDEKVGAAGELFAFEFLAALQPHLPGFNLSNWTSTIRHHTAIHPDYTNIAIFAGRETADIVYEDQAGVLTELLIMAGILPDNKWRGRKPTCYIEVKTTTGNCDTPFYMSGSQHDKMELLTGDGALYIIFRVYRLYSSHVGVRLYVDPVKLKKEGRLCFSAENWRVVPNASL